MARFLQSVAAIICVSGFWVHTPLALEPRRPFGQLPTSLKPIHYRLTVQPFFPADGVTIEDHLNFTFRGNVNIVIECLDETDNITMHMEKIDIENGTVSLSEEPSGAPMPLTDYLYDNKSHQVAFIFGQSLKPGQRYELNMSYSGSLMAADLSGFYTSSYVEDGRTKWLAVTQFEPTDARRALPCFDEPFYKAVFYVTIIHPASMIALSNGMEQGTEKLGDGWSVTTFAPTLNMSTYLLAMAVCDFRSQSNYTKDGKTLFRVWARPSFINSTDYAVAAGPKVLDYYTEYFGIPFPLPKQDMLALPDFAAGAMENWGLVTYRESALLYDERLYSAKNRQRVAVVIAHELAHQWFGDLVTMEWWDDLWLNEGFATFVEYIGTDVISNGAFDMDTQFVSDAVLSALSADQLDTSHPIFVPVSSIDEIFEVFDDISYSKGGSVLRMLNYTLSEEVFRSALNTYLNKHKYENANHNHLWDAMTKAASNTTIRDWNTNSLNVSEFMNPWVLQMGYPVLTAQRTYSGQSKAVSVTQQRFRLRGNETADPNANPKFLAPAYNFTWHVPLWYHTEDAPEVRSAWLEASRPLTLYLSEDNSWLLLNYEAAAYCRVNYDERNWRMLQRQLRSDFTKITTKSRAQLLDDSLKLARAGYLPYDVALDTTTYLVNETAMVPWESAVANLDYLEDMLALSAGYQDYKDYVLRLTRNLYDRYGFDDYREPVDDVPNHYLRGLAVMKQCRLDSSQCEKTALQHFRKFYDACRQHSDANMQCNNLPPGLRGEIYCVGAKQDDESSSHWSLLWELHSKEQVAVEKLRLMSGLCCTKNRTLINRLLSEILSATPAIRRQDAQFVFLSLANNLDALPLLWPFIEHNWPRVKELYAKVGLRRMIISATKSFNTEKQVTKMQKFYNSHSSELGPVERGFKQQLEHAQANKRWMDAYSQSIIAWLKKQK